MSDKTEKKRSECGVERRRCPLIAANDNPETIRYPLRVDVAECVCEYASSVMVENFRLAFPVYDGYVSGD